MRSRCPDDAQEIYMNECSTHRLLGKEEERELITLAKSGDKDARDQLVVLNQKLVVSIAQKYINMAGDLDLLDLIQWGNIGLLRSIDLFDLTRDVRFSTYAVWWIRSILRRNALVYSNQLSVSCGATEIMARFPNAFATLWQKNKRAPTMEEIAEHLESPIKTIEPIWTLFMGNESFDDKVSVKNDGNSITLEEVFPADIPSIEDYLVEKEQSEIIKKVLSELPEQDRSVIVSRFGFDGQGEKTFSEVGKGLDRSRERIRQVEYRALRTIYDALTLQGVNG